MNGTSALIAEEYNLRDPEENAKEDDRGSAESMSPVSALDQLAKGSKPGSATTQG